MKGEYLLLWQPKFKVCLGGVYICHNSKYTHSYSLCLDLSGPKRNQPSSCWADWSLLMLNRTWRKTHQWMWQLAVKANEGKHNNWNTYYWVTKAMSQWTSVKQRHKRNVMKLWLCFNCLGKFTKAQLVTSYLIEYRFDWFLSQIALTALLYDTNVSWV